MSRIGMAVLLLGMAMATSANAAEERRDGNWWQTLNDPTRSVYVAGLFAGMTLGYNLSYWGEVPQVKPPAPRARMAESSKSFLKLYTKYFAGISESQLGDGLTEFYKDARNRRILVNDAIWLVLNQLEGMPEQTLEIMIESWRRNAQ